MPVNLPYVISGTITDTDGSTVVASATVRARNETTGDIILTTTNSSGQYLLDASNFANGWDKTQKFTVYVIYTNLEASTTLDASGTGEHEADLTLSLVADSSLINYCTVQDVYDELDITETDVASQKIIKWVQRAEARIDEKTQTKFVPTTVTNEIYDLNQFTSVRSPEQMQNYGFIGRRDHWLVNPRDKFKLNKSPIISITTLEKNSAAPNSADSWTTLTEQTGSGGDYVVDLSTGWVDFLNNQPKYGKRTARATYIYGTSSVPGHVERLTILLAVSDIVRRSASNSQFNSAEDISIGELSTTNRAGAVSTYLRNLKEELKEAWEEVGVLNAEMT